MKASHMFVLWKGFWSPFQHETLKMTGVKRKPPLNSLTSWDMNEWEDAIVCIGLFLLLFGPSSSAELLRLCLKNTNGPLEVTPEPTTSLSSAIRLSDVFVHSWTLILTEVKPDWDGFDMSRGRFRRPRGIRMWRERAWSCERRIKRKEDGGWFSVRKLWTMDELWLCLAWLWRLTGLMIWDVSLWWMWSKKKPQNKSGDSKYPRHNTGHSSCYCRANLLISLMNVNTDTWGQTDNI